MKKDLFRKTIAGRKAKDIMNLSRISENENSDPGTCIAPRNETEQGLLNIWVLLLNREGLGVQSEFFSSGGNSLKATQLVSRMAKHFAVDLKLTDVFKYTTIEKQAILLGELEKTQIKDIPQLPWQEDYAVSHAQRRLWFIDQFSEGTATYHIPVAGKLNGPVNRPVFYKVFELLLARHESLRTVFTEVNGEPRQKILPSVPYHMFLEEYDALNGSIDGKTPEELVHHIINIPFDLANGLPVRVALIRISAEETLFVCVIHHLVSDGTSMEILMKELALAYNAFCNELPDPLPQLSLQYRDFAAWQHEQLSDGISNNHRKYWLSQFSGELPVLELPTDFPRPAIKSYHGGSYLVRIPAEISDLLNTLAQRTDVSLFVVLQATLYTLFYHYTGQEDIVLGTVTAGRNHSDLEEQVGLYVNTLALRTTFSGNDTFEDLLKSVREVTLEAFDHQIYPFDHLVNELQTERNLGRSPLFDVMIILHNNHTSATENISFNGTTFESYPLPGGFSKFDLTFNFREIGGELVLSVEYDTALFTPAYPERMAGHWQKLIQSLSCGTEQPLSSLEYLNEDENYNLIYGYNDTEKYHPVGTLHELLEAQAVRTPSAHALIVSSRIYTYKEIHTKAGQLAYFLRFKYDLQPGQRIGIMTGRSEWMVISMLAVMKAGGTYVPLDANYPTDRIAYMIKDSKVSILLTERLLQAVYGGLPVNAVCLDDLAEELKDCPADGLSIPGHASDSMYILYTSGSTGVPKGVEIQHSAVVNFLWSMKNYPGINDRDILLAITTCAFDISVLELFLPLIAGAAVLLASTEESKNPELLESLLENSNCTIMQATPSTWRMLITYGWKGKPGLKILCGGERLTSEMASALRIRCAELFNVYGPTETTVWSAVKKISAADNSITVGKPIDNTQFYVLNSHLAPVAALVPGELYIAGEGLAKGYLFLPELTEEQFISNPFIPGKRMYRTGDIACWLPDGELNVLGRADEQVKVRGFRIEPGEIESALLKYTTAGQAFVTVDITTGEPVLIAYLVGDIISGTDEIRDKLRQILPEYMLPAHIITLPELPLTPNGKIDRKKLPVVQDVIGNLQASFTAPRNLQEKSMAAIWEEVLDIHPIGIYDNFFQLGGHSLKAIRMVSRIHEQMGVHLRLPELFTHPTIAGLCNIMGESGQFSVWAIPPAPPQEFYPLSNAQYRLWILQQWKETAGAYHMSNAFHLEGTLDLIALDQAFNALLARHESLRTRFVIVNGEPGQVIGPLASSVFKLKYHDLRGTGVTEEEIKSLAANYSNELFDLEHDLLIRAVLLQTTDTHYIFLLTMHHIISDGWSMQIMIREVLTYYEAFRKGLCDPFPPLSIHYKDYTVWQRNLLKEENILSHQNYWLHRFRDEIPVLNLPLNYPRPTVKSYKGGIVRFSIDTVTVKKLETIVLQQDATLFMGLLALMNTLLFRYTGQEDIIIGSPVAGREHSALEEQIGFYVNTLALRTQFNGSDTFHEVIHKTRTTALEAYDHQIYPFDQLVDNLDLARELNRNPLFDVMLVLQNTAMGNHPLPELQELEISACMIDNQVSKFDWWFSFAISDHGMSATIEYDTALFSSDRITQLAAHFTGLLSAAVAQPDEPVNSYNYLTAAEESKLLNDFNNTLHPFMETETLVSLFERSADNFPDETALVFETKSYSYRELNKAANQLAHYLRDQFAVVPDQLVGLLLDRSPYMIIGILGILKAGAAYVPIDPDYPESRIRYVVSDSGLQVLITEVSQQGAAEGLDCNQICLGEDSTWLNNYSSGNPVKVNSSCDLSYVIYTSGSTGQPKGCELEHKGIVNRIQWMWEHYGFTTGDRILQKTSYVFDVSVWEIFMTLCFGARLVLCRRDEIYSPSALTEIIQKEGITTMHFVPSMFDTFLSALSAGTVDKLTSLLRIITSGEELPLASVKKHHLMLPTTELHNLYGPTEASVDVTFFKTTPLTEKVLIGQPVWNTRIYILDSQFRLVPQGVYGEIYLSGVCLARGYHNKPELTAERFISHSSLGKERLYKTGDTGRFLPDGKIEYAGRNDDQVKIRGYRIELGEVSAAILKHPVVSQVSTIAFDNHDGEKTLAAYVICAPGTLDLLQDAGQLQSERVSEWQSVFEHTYSIADDTVSDPMFNIKGWKSTYTDEPIPAEEMKVWVDDIVTLVLSYRPKNILEIGCGTGLLLFRIAPHTSSYTGTEISATAIEYLTESITTLPGSWDQVKLLQRAAHELTDLPSGDFDTLVINSVVQYFPDAAYLDALIGEAIRLLQPGGRLVIGDIRSLSLNNVFHTSVQYYKAAGDTEISVLQQQIKAVLDNEKELLIDPSYFIDLQRQFDQIGLVEILPKSGEYENELFRFRYQAVITLKGKATEDLLAISWLDAAKGNITRLAITDYITAHKGAPVGIAGVSNSRLIKENRLVYLLDHSEPAVTAGALHGQIEECCSSDMDETVILQLAAENNYQVYTGWGRQLKEGRYDLVLTPSEYIPANMAPLFYNRFLLDQVSADQHREKIGNPMLQQLKNKFIPELRTFLKHTLPEYMVPGFFVLLDKFPLTTNGKLDRKRLPLPVATRSVSGTAYTAPRTAMEEQLTLIWQQVLQIDQIGINDNFFDLGGHSLKATQVVSRMHQQHGLKLDLKTLFAFPTIAGLANALNGKEQDILERIPVAPAQHSYPLSHAQRRLWVLGQWEEAAGAYNMISSHELKGELDKGALQQAFISLVQRHESLRTRFITVAGQPRQLIIPAAEAVAHLHLIPMTSPVYKEDIHAMIKAQAQQPFDLENFPLIRAVLFEIAPARHILVFTMAHIISDGWSMHVLIKEMISMYAAYRRNQELSMPPLRIHYKDYTVWQHQQLSAEMSSGHRAYWLERFRSELPVLELPTDFTRPPVKTYHGNNLHFILDGVLTTGLNQLGKAAGASLYMTLMAVVNSLLYRYTGQEDIIIGSPIAGRYDSELEDQIGFYVNTLALRTRFNGAASFDQLLKELKTDMLDAYEHQIYPFDSLVEELSLTRDTSRSPLFDVMVVLQNTGDDSYRKLPLIEDLNILPYHTGSNGISKADLTFYFTETEEGLSVNIEFNTDLFLQERIHRMFSHFEGICRAVTVNSLVPLQLLDYLSPAERDELLFTSGYKQDFPYKTIQQLVEEQVWRTPLALALVTDEEALTYKELNTRVNQLAQYLSMQYQIIPGELIGILAERNSCMIISMLAVLKAGGAYLPIDPAYPENRISYMLQDAGVRVIIVTDEQLAASVPIQRRSEVLIVNAALQHKIRSYSALNPAAVSTPELLAYCIYTSGSTGQPKGIQISHSNVAAFIHWALTEFADDDFATVFATTSFCFDLSVFEIFYTLCTGKYIRLLQSGADIIHYLDKEERILLNTVPSVIGGLLAGNADLGHVNVINVAGEPVPSYFRQKLDYTRISVRNLYGPSEDTTYSSCYRFTAEHTNIPIGKPVSNTQFYILDQQLQLLPHGIAGEICISGAGLSPGYINQPLLNERQFVSHPFLKGERMYRTGDIGRWLSDGNMEFLGRLDFQVKIRGFRIELGEIETAVSRYPGVKNNVVMVKRDQDDKQLLVAYIQTEEHKDLVIKELKDYLSTCLTAYMIPDSFLVLEQFPLNHNGKIDRQLLPLPETHAASDETAYVGPRNQTETTLASVWESVLGKERIGINDNYFDLGGDSIRAIQVVARLHREGLSIKMGEIFQYLTIARLSERVKVQYRMADQSLVSGKVPLTPIQKEFLYTASSAGLHHYNQAVLLYVAERMNAESVSAAFAKILEHHDALRMFFSKENTGWVQYNADKMPVHLEEYVFDKNPLLQMAEKADQLQGSLHLEKGPLIKLALFHLPDGDRLLIVIHHMVIDGISWRVLFEDFNILYKQFMEKQPLQLSVKTDSYKLWSEELNRYANTPAFLSAELEYWQKVDAVPVFRLPGIGQSGDNLVKHQERVVFKLDREDTSFLLTRVNVAFNTEINDILLSALMKSFHTVFGAASIAVAMEGHGREDLFEHIDVSRTVGWFTAVYPVVLSWNAAAELSRCIKEVKEQLHSIPNKGIGYGLLKQLSTDIKPGSFSLEPQISFNYLGQFDSDLQNTFFTIARESPGSIHAIDAVRQHEWEVNGIIREGCLSISITYSNKQYDLSTMNSFIEQYKTALLAIISLCMSKESVELTPSDFTLKGLSIDTIDNLFD